MVPAIQELQDAGVEPDVWKIEGLDRREDCERMVAIARRDGRERVGCIVLGRGADEDNVERLADHGRRGPGFIGFAVGRTDFWDAIADYEAQKATRQQAITRIATRFSDWVTIFTQARVAVTGTA